jgi:hypothetical protein
MADQKKMFALMAVDDPIKMANKLVAEFPNAHLNVGVGQWLLVGESSLTTKEVSLKLRITDGTSVLRLIRPVPLSSLALATITAEHRRTRGNG